MSRALAYHILTAPTSQPQQEYAEASRMGKLGSKVSEEGEAKVAILAPEKSRYAQRIKPTDQANT